MSTATRNRLHLLNQVMGQLKLPPGLSGQATESFVAEAAIAHLESGGFWSEQETYEARRAAHVIYRYLLAMAHHLAMEGLNQRCQGLTCFDEQLPAMYYEAEESLAAIGIYGGAGNGEGAKQEDEPWPSQAAWREAV